MALVRWVKSLRHTGSQQLNLSIAQTGDMKKFRLTYNDVAGRNETIELTSLEFVAPFEGRFRLFRFQNWGGGVCIAQTFKGEHRKVAMEKSAELERALAVASKILERPNADPDGDLALLARQLMRVCGRDAVRFGLEPCLYSHDGKIILAFVARNGAVYQADRVGYKFQPEGSHLE